jgi:cation:H+ antiporter
MDRLIPQEWFINQPQWLLILICIVALAALIKGADLLVSGVAGIAYRARVSKIVVAATVLSLGTTSPETAVSVTAAWSGAAGLALGNAVGSYICNVALIFGLGAVLTALPADRYVLQRQGIWHFGSAALLAAICALIYATMPADPVLGRWAGVLLLTLLAGYISLSIYWGRRHAENEPFVDRVEQVVPVHPRLSILLLLSLAGLVLVVVASRVFVASITVLAEVHWYVPKVVVAATIVAVGTSLPELVVSLTSVYRGHGEVLVGNIIGANVLNILWVTGASAVAAPLPLIETAGHVRYPLMFLWLHVPAMMLIAVVFGAYILASTGRRRFRRWYGWPLLAIYLVYVVVQIYLS